MPWWRALHPRRAIRLWGSLPINQTNPIQDVWHDRSSCFACALLDDEGIHSTVLHYMRLVALGPLQNKACGRSSGLSRALVAHHAAAGVVVGYSVTRLSSVEILPFRRKFWAFGWDRCRSSAGGGGGAHAVRWPLV